MNHYEQLIKLCTRAKVQVNNKTTNKTKDYPQLLNACHRRKRDIVKGFNDNMHPYGTKNGYNSNCTDHIELLTSSLLKKLQAVDKIIFMIEKEMSESDKRYNICDLMNIKSSSKSASCSDVDLNSAYVAEYSNGDTFEL